MKLNHSYDNNIASFGYNTLNTNAFMTVHMNSQGIYLPKELPRQRQSISQ